MLERQPQTGSILAWQSLPIVLALGMLSLFWVLPQAESAPSFPTLTGRVVDEAGLLSSSVKRDLENRFADYERATSNQVVVVTLRSLQGYSIEDYGYQLGRHWAIGQQDEDNGVLLIVAPKERKVRIEVGYGLEGQLTDALSHNIIQTQILPLFRQAKFEQGIVAGSQAVLDVLGGAYEPAPVRTAERSPRFQGLFMLFVFVIIGGQLLSGLFKSGVKSGLVVGGIAFFVGWLVLGSIVLGVILAFLLFFFHVFFSGGSSGPLSGTGGYYGGYRRGGYSGGSFGGGGFSGGGGSFGGGGASGGW